MAVGLGMVVGVDVGVQLCNCDIVGVVVGVCV